MNKKIFLISFSIICFVSTMAQVNSKDIQFKTKTIDFGTILEESGIVAAEFSFTNNSSNDFIIHNVSAACGCTNPRASKDTFAPGENGSIHVEFNPKGMRGSAKKWVNISGNISNTYQIELSFVAQIESEIDRNTGKYYRGQYGYLLVDKTSMNWGNKLKNTYFEDSLVLTNDGYGDITIFKISNNPNFIKAQNLPITIAKGKSQTLRLSIETKDIDTIGGYNGILKLLTDDQFYKKKDVIYSLNFINDYSKLRKREIKRAAKISLNKKVVEMGKMKGGGIRTKSITITNTGKSELTFLRIDTDCSCTLLSLPQRVLSPDESITVNVKFDALYKEGLQNKIITIYTNDPINPISYIRVRANVVKK